MSPATPSPHLTIDLDKIEHNARAIGELCGRHGIAVTGVTKVTCGHPAVAAAMLRGGVSSLGDSHVANIRRLKRAGVVSPYMLLQIPAPSAVDEIVACADVSLNSELAVLEALSEAAVRGRRIHAVILMVDLGDLREGIWADELVAVVRETLRLRGIRIKGIGTNLACFGAVRPSEDNMQCLVDLAVEVEHTFGLALEWISGINSSGLDLLAMGRTPKRVNHARIGEAILLGRETVQRRPWPGTFQDAFMLRAEIVELKKKPSVPVGERCQDAFGRLPVFADHGEIVRALFNVGREDVDVDGISPIDPRIAILGASSDYLVADVTAAAASLRVGDEVAFSLSYGALLAAMTSEYVTKRPLRGGVLVTDGSGSAEPGVGFVDEGGHPD